MYLDVANKVKNGKAILTSPLLQDSYSNCVFNISYHMNGDDVGQLRIRLSPNHSSPTILFEIFGKIEYLLNMNIILLQLCAYCIHSSILDKRKEKLVYNSHGYTTSSCDKIHI